MRLRTLLLSSVLGLGVACPAQAQVLENPVTVMCLTGGATGQPVAASSANPCPVALGTGSSTVGGVFVVPSGASGSGITAIVSASAENNHVLKASAGNLYSVYATNLTGTAGFLVILNATSAPVDGAIAPLDWVTLPGNSTASINYRAGPPAVYSTGIVAVVTSATTPFTKTTGVITAAFHGDVQ